MTARNAQPHCPLPAPAAAEGVPLAYKFSWSPRGVLRAAGEGAQFLLDGQVRPGVFVCAVAG